MLNQEMHDTAAILKKSLYVDNIIAGLDPKADALDFKEKASKLLSAAKFELTPWTKVENQNR